MDCSMGFFCLMSACQPARCGDGIVSVGEQCDLGAANESNPYGTGKCTTACTTAPRCGDGRVDMAFGEQCDGGMACDPMCHLTGMF